MTPAERVASALGSPDSGRTLRSVVREMAREGFPKAELYALLEKCLLDLRLRADHPESEEDLLLDVMDALDGWCHPDARLLPESELS